MPRPLQALWYWQPYAGSQSPTHAQYEPTMVPLPAGHVPGLRTLQPAPTKRLAHPVHCPAPVSHLQGVMAESVHSRLQDDPEKEPWHALQRTVEFAAPSTQKPRV